VSAGGDTPASRKRRIREWGHELGFDRVGFAVAEEPPGSRRLLDWLSRGYQAGMGYMARDPQARLDPQKILAGARSVVVCALDYLHPGPVPLRPEAPKISRYAWGDDYHEVLGEKLRILEARIREDAPAVKSRIACDTSPVMDKAWGAAAGAGWQGKNTCLIHPDRGSWFFLGEILLDLELPPDSVIADHCGTCRRCLDACPTGALVEPYLLDARFCISYLTIEHRGEFTREQGERIRKWLVGCDICQEVCPWNHRAPVSREERFRPRAFVRMTAEEWAGISDESYRDRVCGTAVTRIKPAAMRRNVEAVLRNRPDR
jgi:epoxyqueuosine reductase